MVVTAERRGSGLQPGFMRTGRTRAIDGPAGCVPSFPEGAGDQAAVTARAGGGAVCDDRDQPGIGTRQPPTRGAGRRDARGCGWSSRVQKIAPLRWRSGARFRPFIGLVSCEKVGQSSRRCSATLGYELTSGAALGWKCRWRSAPRRACRGISSVIRSRTCRFSKLGVVTNAFGHGVGLVVEEAAPAGE